MKKLGTIVSVLSLGVIVALQGSAGALPCSAGCGQEKNACVQTARVARSACKQDCRANAAPTALGACMIGCSATYRSAKTDCQADHVSCQGACKPPAHPGPPSPPSNCLGTCGQDLATCTKDLVAQRKSCAAACDAPSERGACLTACVAAAKQQAESCRSDFDACRDACSASPSGAFVE